MNKKKLAIFLAGIMVAGIGLSFHINHEKSQEFADRIASFSESIEDDDFLISAHRGFSSLAVENTEDAISLAAEKNYVDYIEIDARMTPDSQIVLSHDNALTVTMDHIQYVSLTPYDELMETTYHYYSTPSGMGLWRVPEKSFLMGRYEDLNGREYHIANLLEGILASGDKKILLDLKFPFDVEHFVECLKEELKDVDTSRIVFQSLDLNGIRYLKEHSDYTCSALVDKVSELDMVKDFDHIGIKSSILTPEIVERLLKEGKQIFVWTIDNSKELKRVADLFGEHYLDVNYITDFPDFIAMELDQYQKVKTTQE